MDIQLPQILFQLINFSVVVGALSYLLYRPILKILEERSKRIEEAAKAAQKTIAEKDRLQEMETEIMQKAKRKAGEIVEEARTAAKQTQAQAEEVARKKADKYLEKAKADWSEEKKQHLADMKKTFVEAVTATASKVLEADLDSKKHSKLIDSQLDMLVKKM